MSSRPTTPANEHFGTRSSGGEKLTRCPVHCSTSFKRSNDSRRPAELSRPSCRQGIEGQLLISARVQCDPNQLKQVVDEATIAVWTKFGIRLNVLALQHFSPARLQPTHHIRLKRIVVAIRRVGHAVIFQSTKVEAGE